MFIMKEIIRQRFTVIILFYLFFWTEANLMIDVYTSELGLNKVSAKRAKSKRKEQPIHQRHWESLLDAYIEEA